MSTATDYVTVRLAKPLAPVVIAAANGKYHALAGAGVALNVTRHEALQFIRDETGRASVAVWDEARGEWETAR